MDLVPWFEPQMWKGRWSHPFCHSISLNYIYIYTYVYIIIYIYIIIYNYIYNYIYIYIVIYVILRCIELFNYDYYLVIRSKRDWRDSTSQQEAPTRGSNGKRVYSQSISDIFTSSLWVPLTGTSSKWFKAQNESPRRFGGDAPQLFAPI